MFETHGKEESERAAAQMPPGLGAPCDIGLAMAFLCSDGGRYIGDAREHRRPEAAGYFGEAIQPCPKECGKSQDPI